MHKRIIPITFLPSSQQPQQQEPPPPQPPRRRRTILHDDDDDSSDDADVVEQTYHLRTNKERQPKRAEYEEAWRQELQTGRRGNRREGDNSRNYALEPLHPVFDDELPYATARIPRRYQPPVSEYSLVQPAQKKPKQRRQPQVPRQSPSTTTLEPPPLPPFAPLPRGRRYRLPVLLRSSEAQIPSIWLRKPKRRGKEPSSDSSRTSPLPPPRKKSNKLDYNYDENLRLHFVRYRDQLNPSQPQLLQPPPSDSPQPIDRWDDETLRDKYILVAWELKKNRQNQNIPRDTIMNEERYLYF